MAGHDKIEAVKQVNKAEQDPVQNQYNEAETTSQAKEQFQNALNTSTTQKPNFQKIDGAFVIPENEGVKEKNPILTNESATTQKNGSATDQEGKKKNHESVEEIDEVETKKTIDPAYGNVSESQKLDTSAVRSSNPEDIGHQAQNIIGQIEEAKTKLSQSKTDIKPAYQKILTHRLSHIDDNLKIALSKVGGVENNPAVKNVGNDHSKHPAGRFIDMLTRSQQQLENLHLTIDQVGMSGKELTPTAMLTLQLKMHYVQQQVELFTSILNKALESTKTLMNVQV